MYEISDLLMEANDVSDQIWFVQSFDVTELTDTSVSLRLYIREDFWQITDCE